ncbi:non-ribosomal peptide synthetase [Actinomadura macrotermitis]|uniref:Dimodular nonribosomal peptide synthase n=1 Tax=Actinomadura macrotermitis TaxID=2585200 RepID=A0A7K0BLR0_9ACTN|nr:non-ribosomal peptide synthetase [Actinomadura macrotermitis]MQY02119.1 Dimodular nonribosomal peptide synthase [Actinomadura macrotermitis]
MTTSAESQTTTALEGFPLSPQQRHAWRSHEATGRPVPALTCAVDIDGDLDREALRGAVSALVRRHEILRTAFRPVPGLAVPVQVVNATADVPIEEAGPAGRAPWERGPADLTGPSQLRVVLCRRSPGRYTLLLRLPVLCADGTGMANLVGELMDLYRSGPPPADEPHRPQYADLAEWMNEIGVAEETADPSAVAGALRMPFEIPAAAAAAADPGDEAEEPVDVPLTPAGWELLRRAAERLSVPPRTLLTACWAATLHRYTRQQATTLTVAVDGSGHDGLHDMIGPFRRDLPMRLELSGTMPIGEAAQQVARLEAGLRAELLSSGGDRPAADTVAFAHVAVPALPEGGGVTASIGSLDLGARRHPLELRCVEFPGSAGLTLAHCPRRYHRDDVVRLATSLGALIGHASAEPETAVGDLRLIDADTRRPRYRPCSGHTAGPGAGTAGAPPLVHELFERCAAATPHATAVVHEDDRLTYAELRGHARRVAARLADAGVRPGDLVPLLADRGVDAVAAVLGVLMAGAAYVPIDPATPAERLAFLLDDTGARSVLVQDRLAGLLPPGPARVRLDPLRGERAAPGRPLPETPPHRPAYVIYTSGTTGRPKGVVVEHGQLAHYVAGVTEVLGAPVAGAFAMVSSMGADLGNTAMFHALCGGGTLHVIGADLARSPDALAAYLRDSAIDRMKIVPSHLRALLDAAARPGDLLPRVAVVLGGEPLQRELAERIAALAPSCTVINHYGPTEATVGVSTHDVSAHGVDQRCRTVPIGRPIGESRLLVADPRGNPVPDWVPGEAYLGGPQVARGYLNRPDLTAERFLTDPGGAPGARVYRTGDLVRRLPGGAHEFLGRVDDQVKIRGYRVEPGEVEAVVRAHPGVRDAVVLAREDDAGDRYLAAYLVPRVAGADVGLREFLRARLPDHMVPAAVEAVSALPLTANGKVDRAALLGRAAPAGPARTVVAPRDAEEERLLAIWKDTLPPGPLGVTDNFFDVGGNSLLAVRLIAQIRKATGRALPLAALFPAGTVESMAAFLREDGHTPDGPDEIMVPIRPGGSRRPFFCVHAGGGTTLGYQGLAAALGPEQPFYAMQSLGLDGVREPLPSITEMARRYVERMRRVQPEGPYVIGGWCLGGIIAYEMARVLRTQGKRVALLVVIDTESPLTAAAALAAAPSEEPAAGDTALFRRFAWHFGFQDLHPDLDGLTSDQQLRHLFDLARDQGVLPPDAGQEQLGHLLRVYKHNIQAVNAYLRDFTPGDAPDHPVVLYRPVRELDDGQDAGFGWPALAGPRLTIDLVPGDHHSVMRPPAVTALAARLGALLGTLRQEGV